MAAKNPFLKKATGAQKAPARVEKKHGLGRGLDSLIPGTKTQPLAPVAPVAVKPAVPVVPAAPVAKPEPSVPFELKIADIERSPYQPRREFREEELRELAESLKNSGLVQPPTVRKNAAGKWELIAGERRIRAAQLAGWTKIQVTVKDVDDLTAAAMTTTENINREDLNPIEEAVSYKTLQDTFNLTQADVAEKVGKGRATVANAVRLLELPEEVKALVQGRLLSVGHAKVLLSLEDEKERILLARECVNDQLSVRALEKKVARLSKFFDGVAQEAEVSLEDIKEGKRAKIQIGVPGDTLIIERVADTFENAVTGCVDAMKEKLTRTKEKKYDK